MTNKTLRAAVLGLGMGRHHAVAYRQIPGVELAALCDSHEATLAARAAGLPGVKTTTDWREIARDPSIDIVSVCTPDRQHFEQAAALVLAGKHVLCEKPMVVSEEEARILMRCVQESGVKFAVGNVNRFVPQFALAARYAREGRLGDLFMVESDYIHDMRAVFKRTPWRADPEQPQNAIFGGGVHPVDLVRWLAGEVTAVFAAGNHKTVPEYNSQDNILIDLKFAGGCLGRIWITFGVRRQPEHLVNLNAFGSEGTIYTDSERPEARLYVPAVAEDQYGWATIPFAPIVGHPVLAELTHFVECIRNDQEPLVNVVDAAHTVAVLAAAQRSIEQGLPMGVADIERKMTGEEQLLMRLPAVNEMTDLVDTPLPEGYALRVFRDADTRPWLNLCNPAIGTTWTEADFGERMLEAAWYSPDRVYIAEYNGELVGTACAWQEKPAEQQVGYTHMVAVSPEHQGRGLGRALMVRVLRWFRDHGFSESLLNTDDFRLPAIALYLDLGFEPVIRDDFHRRRWEAVKLALEARQRNRD